jgi:hypothetical protein
MNEELLAASVLFVQSGALLVSHNVFINFFALGQCSAKPNLHSAVHQQTAKFFQQTLSAPQRELWPQICFENTDRLREQKRTGRQFHNTAPINKL